MVKTSYKMLVMTAFMIFGVSVGIIFGILLSWSLYTNETFTDTYKLSLPPREYQLSNSPKYPDTKHSLGIWRSWPTDCTINSKEICID